MMSGAAADLETAGTLGVTHLSKSRKRVWRTAALRMASVSRHGGTGQAVRTGQAVCTHDGGGRADTTWNEPPVQCVLNSIVITLNGNYFHSS